MHEVGEGLVCFSSPWQGVSAPSMHTGLEPHAHMHTTLPMGSRTATNNNNQAPTQGKHTHAQVKGSRERNGGAADSVAKLDVVLQLCQRLGVHTSPAQLGALWVAPVLSWHHKGWDEEPDVPGMPRASAMTIADYAACHWQPSIPGGQELGSDALAAWFDGENERRMDVHGSWGELWRQAGALLAQPERTAAPGGRDCGTKQAGGRHVAAAVDQAEGTSGGGDDPEGRSAQPLASSSSPAPVIITASHFLPHQALLPEKRFLSYPNLVCGCPHAMP